MTNQIKIAPSKLNENPALTNLLNRIGQSDMLTTAYDTAWLARLSEFDSELGLPALEWLSSNQLPDGSWGAAESYYYPDRVISTLSAMIALTYRGRRQSDKRQIEKGLEALEKMTENATSGLASALKGPTVGFEMIVPTLVEQAESLGIIKQQKERILGRISKQRAKKLSLIKGKMINRDMTVAFSAEMAGTDGQHLLDIENLQEKNGSVGCSPSATAYFALQVKKEDQQAMEYLYRSRGNNGGVPNVAPFDVFEVAWTLWNLSIIPGYENLEQQAKQHVDFLSQAWENNRGAGFSSEYSVNDSDETSIVYDTLSRYGVEKNVGFILSFEEKDHFRCFDLENDPSISANVHVLGALRQAGFKKENSSVRKILHFLQNSKLFDTYWDDKWHISPYYTTTHAIMVCSGYENELVAPAVDWLINTQKSDGSWGIFESTPEETAYTIQALWLWDQNVKNIPKEILYRGKIWLEEHQHEYPPLWIGKCLYSPRLVIDSAIQCALSLEI
ncbi:MAG: prenyltransferase/squalene oxidase repeat-containing protein [Anaerolineales bacterium]|jgi:halimadienyl-diphosphate synthase